MLVLSRRKSEGLWIDGRIYIKVLDVNRGRAKLGINAPEAVPIIREELSTMVRPSVGSSVSRMRAGDGSPKTREMCVALERAKVALEEAAPFLPANSTADLAASRAIATIYKVLRTSNS